MVVNHHVIGYDEFCNFIKGFKSDGEFVHIYFSGSKLPSGESWCSDCVEAYPAIEANLQKAPAKSHFIYVECGDRETWKNMKCPFRTDPSTKLMVLPTLLRWKTPRRLEGEQCGKEDLVEMLLTDED